MKRYRWNKRRFAENMAMLASAAACAALNVWILYEWIMGA